MGLTGTTTFTKTTTGQKRWYYISYTGGQSGWASLTSDSSIEGIRPGFLTTSTVYTGDDTHVIHIKYLVLKVKTDEAGCSSLTFTFNSSSISSISYTKVTTDLTINSSGSNLPSGWVSTTKSGATYTVNNVSLLPNTTYYLWLRSNDNTSGHATGGTVTVSASGTYGAPGAIIANDCNFDEPINMSYASSTSGAKYTVTVKLGSSSPIILQTFNGEEGSVSSRSWTPSLETYADSYPNSKTVSCLITVQTYFGTTLSGTQTKTVGVSFTEEQVGPSTNNAFSIVPSNEDAVEDFDGYIENYSKILASFDPSNVTLQNNATIASWSVKFGSGSTNTIVWNSSDPTTDYKSDIISQDTIVICTVTDSRGFTASETYTVTIIPYQFPTIDTSVSSLKRTNSSGTETDDGTYLRVDLVTTYASVDSQNEITVTVYKKAVSASDYDQGTVIQSGTTTTSGTNNILTLLNYKLSGLQDISYDVKLVVEDLLGNEIFIYTRLPSQSWALHIRSGGLGAAFGKAAEADYQLQIPDTWEYYKGLNKAILSAYPVDSIYISLNNTDPGTLFGGTWSQLSNNFQLGSGGATVYTWQRTQ